MKKAPCKKETVITIILMNTHYESSIRKLMVTNFLLGVHAIASSSGSTTLNIIGNKHNSQSDCYVFKKSGNQIKCKRFWKGKCNYISCL